MNEVRRLKQMNSEKVRFEEIINRNSTMTRLEYELRKKS